jgi:hypothetical protein
VVIDISVVMTVNKALTSIGRNPVHFLVFGLWFLVFGLWSWQRRWHVCN